MTPEVASDGSPQYWWFNLKTGQVELGVQSASLDRVGPFETEAEAKRAPETIRQRAQRWRDEEAEED